MDFLKDLFASGALTWEQFAESAKKQGLELVNAAAGAYVPKADLDTKERELGTANETIRTLRETAKVWDGKDPKKLADDLRDLQAKYDADTANIRKEAAIDLALIKARARDPQLTRAALNLDEIKLDASGKATGLDAQIESLKQDKAWLFEATHAADKPDNKPGQNTPSYTPPAGGKPNTASDLAGALAEHYNVN